MVIEEADLLRRAREIFTVCADERYSYYNAYTEYAGIKPKWFVFHSSEQQRRKERTFEKRIEKELEKSMKSLKRLTTIRFACKPDAQNGSSSFHVGKSSLS